MSTAVEKSCLVGGVVIGPIADTTGLTGLLYRANASVSNGSFAINAAIRGKWLNMYAKGTNFQFAFRAEGGNVAGTAATLVYDQAVTPGTGSLAAGGTVPAGIVTPVLIPCNATHLSLISETATGVVECYISEYLAGGK